MERRTTDLGEDGIKGGGIEQNGKGIHGHGQQCDDDCRGGEKGIRGLNGNGKNTIKNRKKYRCGQHPSQ